MSLPNIDPKEFEAKVILGALNSGDLKQLKSRGLTKDSFSIWGNVLEFVYDYDKKYRKVPSVETIYLSFPDFPSFSSDGVDINYLIDSIVENSKKTKLREIVDRTIDELLDKSGDPNRIIHSIMKDISKLKSYDTVGSKYLDDTSTDRLRKFIEKKEAVARGETIGVPSGICALDKEMITWNPGDFVLIIGPPGVGKSFILERMCVTAHVAGNKVLYVCPEMIEHNVALRFDVMEGRIYGYTFSLESLRKGGETDPAVYGEWLQRIEGRKNWIIVDSVDSGEKFTVDKLEALVAEHNPDVIGVDSLTQFTSQSGALAVGWTDMIEITNSVKTLATKTKKIFLAIGPSTGDTFGTYEPATLAEIGLSRGAAYKPDVMISLSKSMEETKRYMKLIKMREGRELLDKMDIAFEPDSGRIE